MSNPHSEVLTDWETISGSPASPLRGKGLHAPVCEKCANPTQAKQSQAAAESSESLPHMVLSLMPRGRLTSAQAAPLVGVTTVRTLHDR